MNTEVISCSTGPHSWHTYKLELSQFGTGDEGEDEGDPPLPLQLCININNNSETESAGAVFPGNVDAVPACNI